MTRNEEEKVGRLPHGAEPRFFRDPDCFGIMGHIDVWDRATMQIVSSALPSDLPGHLAHLNRLAGDHPQAPGRYIVALASGQRP